MRRPISRTGLLVAVGVVSLGLVGCSANSPFELSIVDGQPAFVYCDPDEPAHLEISQQAADEYDEEDFVVIASQLAPINLQAGEPIVVGRGELDIEYPELFMASEGTTYSVEFMYFDYIRRDIFNAPAGGLQEGVWLRSNGELNETACDRG